MIYNWVIHHTRKQPDDDIDDILKKEEIEEELFLVQQQIDVCPVSDIVNLKELCKIKTILEKQLGIKPLF